MNAIKTTWEDTASNYGQTIEGIVDWTLKYMRIWFCFLGTLFVVAAILILRLFTWATKAYTAPRENKIEAEKHEVKAQST